MKAPHPISLWLYGGALVIYPRRLRLEYREQMLRTLLDAYRDRRGGAPGFWINAYGDLLRSSFMERYLMVQGSCVQRPLAYYTFALAAIFTLLGGGASLTIDQMLRRGANQPQIDMAAWYAGEIAAGEDPANVIPPGYVDLERSLQPFVIYYDDQGKPGPGTGYLGQKLPSPPPGVFDFVRRNGSEIVTWQPQPGVRLASIIRRVDGPKPGFVLAARSLRLVEEQKTVLWQMAFGIWLAVLVLLFGGAALLNRAQRMKRTPA